MVKILCASETRQIHSRRVQNNWPNHNGGKRITGEIQPEVSASSHNLSPQLFKKAGCAEAWTQVALTTPLNEDRLELPQMQCAEDRLTGMCNARPIQAECCPPQKNSAVGSFTVYLWMHLLKLEGMEVSICMAFWFWMTSVNHELSTMIARVYCCESNDKREGSYHM